MAIKNGTIYPYERSFLLNSELNTFDFDTYEQKVTHSTDSFAILGSTVTNLTENPNAETSTTGFIVNVNKSTSVDRYAFVFEGTAELNLSDPATKAIHDIPYHSKTGQNAVRELCLIDMYNQIGENAYTARLFSVAVAVSELSGTGTEKIMMSFTLSAEKDPVIGTWSKDEAGKGIFTADETQKLDPLEDTPQVEENLEEEDEYDN